MNPHSPGNRVTHGVFRDFKPIVNRAVVGLNSWGEYWGVQGTFKVGLCVAWLQGWLQGSYRI